MQKYDEMLDALRTSVIEIVTANAADRDEKLRKSLDGFGAALRKSLDEDVPLSPQECDPVSLMADQLAALTKSVEAIEAGSCLELAKGVDVMPDTMALAKVWLDLGEMVVRQMASDFAEPLTQGEKPPSGVALYKVATSEGEVLVKSVLPTEVAGLIADPEDIADEVTDLSFALLAHLGLTKGDVITLAKKAPAFIQREEGEDEEEDAEDEGDEDEGTDGEEEEDAEGDEGEDPDGEFAEGEGDNAELDGSGDDNPLENVAELGAMMLMEIERMGGAAAPPADDPNAEAGPMGAIESMAQMAAMITVQADALAGAVAGDAANPDAQEAAEEATAAAAAAGEGEQNPGDQGAAAEDEVDEARKAAPGAGHMKKGVQNVDKATRAMMDAKDREIAELKKQLAGVGDLGKTVAEMQAALKKLQEEPTPAKASLAGAGGATVLSKTADNGGTTEEEQLQKIADRIQGMSPEQQAQELIKLAHRTGGVPGHLVHRG